MQHLVKQPVRLHHDDGIDDHKDTAGEEALPAECCYAGGARQVCRKGSAEHGIYHRHNHKLQGKQDVAGEEVDAEPQIDRAAELNEIWQVKPGDLWQCGDHRIICGDCTDSAVVERVMQGEKADLVFTDPPYGISVVGGDKPYGKVGGGGRSE